MGDGLDLDQGDRVGLKRETWCHFGKAWCHFVWFDWLACLPFCFCLAVLLGCVSENVCCCICFYSWGLCSPCISLSPYSSCKDVLLFFWMLHLCFKPQLSSFSSTSPSSDSAEGSVCQSRHSCFEAGETNYHRPQKLSTPASSLKSPLPLSHPAGDWGVRYLTDEQEYWELHRTL